MPEPGTYKANGFSPQTGARFHSGELRVLLDQVRFESGTLNGTLPLAGLRLRRGGHNDEQLFFEHPEFPGWSFYTSDDRLMHDPILTAHPNFSGELLRLARRKRSTPPIAFIGIGLVALVLACLVGLWLAKDRIAEYIADKIPISWEQKFGDQVYAQVAQQGKILTDSKWAPEIKRITDRLEPVVAKSGYTFQFHIVQDTNVNAFAIPGGHVVILTGLLEHAESSEEVAGVLAHELAHVTRKHSLRNMIKSAGLILMIQAVLGDASGLLALAGEGSRFLLQQKFSRDFEREADDTGWSYLTEARIDPRGMITFFKKMKVMIANAGMSSMENSLALLNTHPASQERIDHLSEKWEQSPIKTGFVDVGPWKKRE
jgi:Zn-dependent protease with chaperone function